MAITATRTLINLGDDVNITCSVQRGNPTNYLYLITHIASGNTTSDFDLFLTNIQVDDLGIYRCNVTSDAGTGNASVMIDVGGMAQICRYISCWIKLISQDLL